MNSAWIVLDRDGVINFDSDDYIKSAEEWRPLPGSIDAIAKLKAAGYKVAVVTNQSGLGRGLFDLDDLEAMHEKMQALLAEEHASIDAIFYCPHAPDDNCNCRKPATGMLDALEDEFSVDISGAYFVGDSLKDLQLAVKKQCRPVLVLTGKGKLTQNSLEKTQQLKDTPVFPDLREFVNTLLKGSNS